MKGTLKRKKKKFWKPVAACFIILYLVTMLLVTLQVKRRYENEYNQSFEEIAASLLRKASEHEMAKEETDDFEEDMEADSAEEAVENIEDDREFYQALANDYFFSTTNPSRQISVAVYDKDKKLAVRSCDVIGDMYTASTSDVSYGPYIVDEYLTFNQKEELASYRWKYTESSKNYTQPEQYRILTEVSPDGQEMYGIYVQELTWGIGEKAEKKQYKDPLTKSLNTMQTGITTDYATGEESGGETIYYETDSKVVWEWTNPEVSESQRKAGEIQSINLIFPYINSYEKWHGWSSSEYLHDFPQQSYFTFAQSEGREYPELENYSDLLHYRVEYQLKVGYVDNPSAYMAIRMEENTWFDAFAYMKSLYLAGMVLTLVCMFVTIAAFNQVYEQQMALEDTRRDFTNAMAHELKTPLGVIRNFAENLLEHNMEEKREYYLTQIIGQTEEMDQLVAGMIEISKLDSEELALQKEPVSMMAVVREQMDRFEPLIDEKNLQVMYQEEADFLIEGDREYLARAVWNLLSNAVEYNVLDGRITVRTEAKSCSIENTGKCMEEEQILHAFDLFYTGDKSRDRKGKHMGVGLFLAKKILELHGMSLMLENTDDGVRAVIKK